MMTSQRINQLYGSIQIRNIFSNLAIRPLNAGIADGTPIIQYPPHYWKCETWRLLLVKENCFQLQNLYTKKFLIAITEQQGRCYLSQGPSAEYPQAMWRFNQLDGNRYTIQSSKNNLLITSPNCQVNDRLYLSEHNNSPQQVWIVKKQRPLL